MPSASFVQQTFLGGSWSPFAQGNVLHPKYKTAMNICLNSYPIGPGAWSRRGGFELCALTQNGLPGRVIQFNFTDLSEYRVELTSTTARLFAGRSLVFTDVAAIVNISTDIPAVVTLATPVTWASGDLGQVLPITHTDASQGHKTIGQQYTLSKADSTHFFLADQVTGLPIDGSTLNWGSGIVANFGRVLKLTTPYTGTQWQQVRLIAAAAVGAQGQSEAILLHGSYPPQVIGTPQPLTGGNLQPFALQQATFQDGPYFDPPVSGNFQPGLTPNLGGNFSVGGTLKITGTVGASKVGDIIDFTVSDPLAVGPNGFVASDVGRSMRFFIEPSIWRAAAPGYAGGNYVKWPAGDSGNYYISSNNVPQGVPPGSSNLWVPVAPTVPVRWVWGLISTVTSNTEVKVTMQANLDGNTYAFAYQADTNPLVTWRMGVFCNTVGWPKAGTYWQGRLWFTGVVGNRIDSSNSNDIFNMAPTDTSGSVGASDGISIVFDADNTNEIFWLKPTSAGLVAGTKNGEWLISAPTQGPIAPTNIQANKATDIGMANVLPITTPLTNIVLHKYSRELYEYFPDVFSGRLTSPNLNEFAKHLVTAGILELAYQSELAPIVWARCGDGTLAGCTYRRVTLYGSEPPEYSGWHQHVLGGGHLVESLTVGPDPTTTLDALYLVEFDPTTNVRHVTVSRPLLDENTNLTNAWLVDDGIVPYGSKFATVKGVAGLQLYGLSLHNGETVTAQLCGLDCGDYPCVNGSIFVPFLSDPGKMFTQAYMQSISDPLVFDGMGFGVDGTSLTIPGAVGFTFTSQGQLLRPILAADVGTVNGPALAKTRRVHMFAMLVAAGVTNTIQVGTAFNKAHAMNFKSPGGKALPTSTLYSGLYWDTIEDGYDFDGMVAWQVTRPVPAIVAAISVFDKGSDR